MRRRVWQKLLPAAFGRMCNNNFFNLAPTQPTPFCMCKIKKCYHKNKLYELLLYGKAHAESCKIGTISIGEKHRYSTESYMSLPSKLVPI